MGLFSPSRSMKDFALLDRVKVVLHVHMVLYSLNIPIVMMYNLPNSRGFKILKDRENLVSDLLPNGDLHVRQIFGSSLTLFVVSIICGICSAISILSNRSHGSLKSLYVKFLWFITIVLIPTNLAVTIIGGSRSARISSALPEFLVDQLLITLGESLKYRDIGVVVGFIVLGWMLFLAFLIGATRDYSIIFREKSEVNSQPKNVEPKKNSDNNENNA
ncbi:hypothetical protein BY996DRAFT_6409443 [Phakopsora pachyrhizi]|nr:hypothetical protein BY996DRAFT_6409443 [Phakopsora pachyrhizi]